MTLDQTKIKDWLNGTISSETSLVAYFTIDQWPHDASISKPSLGFQFDRAVSFQTGETAEFKLAKPTRPQSADLAKENEARRKSIDWIKDQVQAASGYRMNLVGPLFQEPSPIELPYKQGAWWKLYASVRVRPNGSELSDVFAPAIVATMVPAGYIDPLRLFELKPENLAAGAIWPSLAPVTTVKVVVHPVPANDPRMACVQSGCDTVARRLRRVRGKCGC